MKHAAHAEMNASQDVPFLVQRSERDYSKVFIKGLFVIQQIIFYIEINIYCKLTHGGHFSKTSTYIILCNSQNNTLRKVHSSFTK